MDSMSVKVGVARGIGHHRGVDGFHSVEHGVNYKLLLILRVEAEKRGHALRHGLAGDDNNVLFRHRYALLGRHDDVLVVGEHKNGGCWCAVYGVEYIVSGGVHGLAAGHNAVRAELTEERRHALTRAHRHNAELLLRLGKLLRALKLGLDSLKIVGALRLAPGDKVVVLGAHVLYLGKLQCAVLLRLVERVAGGVGVYVNLERLIVLTDDKAVADAVEIGAEGVKVKLALALAHDEHRVKGKGNLLGAENVKGRLLRHIELGGRVGRHDLTAQRGEHGAENDEIALAARVDNARLFQHGVEVHGVGQRVLAGLDGADEHVFKACPGLCRLNSRAGGEAGDGENGTLGGLHNGLVRRVNARGHGRGEFHAVSSLRALEALGDAAEQKREDNAGVSARAAKQGGGHAVCGLVDGGELALAQFGGGVVESEAHVGAGVPVRHGENVELVNGLYICMERRVRAQYHFFERGGINIFFQICLPPELIR